MQCVVYMSVYVTDVKCASVAAYSELSTITATFTEKKNKIGEVGI